MLQRSSASAASCSCTVHKHARTHARKNTTCGENNKHMKLHAGAQCHAESCSHPRPHVCCCFTFWEANDCVQWYKTSLSLLKGFSSAAGSSHSSPSVTLPSSSIAEMGHQLQLVGVTWLEDAMTERFVRVVERRGARGGREGKGRQKEGRERDTESERERGEGGWGGFTNSPGAAASSVTRAHLQS